jgi:hypothetical protein
MRRCVAPGTVKHPLVHGGRLPIAVILMRYFIED